MTTSTMTTPAAESTTLANMQAMLCAIANQLDVVVRSVSAFPSFLAMLDAEGGYRPTIRVEGKDRLLMMHLADCYDAAQAARGDSRRAFRSR